MNECPQIDETGITVEPCPRNKDCYITSFTSDNHYLKDENGDVVAVVSRMAVDGATAYESEWLALQAGLKLKQEWENWCGN